MIPPSILTMSRISRFALATLGAAAASPLAAQQRPAARPLGPAIVTSEPFAAISAVRQLPGGRVLLNDPASHRVVLLDSTLKVIRVVADSTSATANAYGARPGGLMPYRGDSTLFVDPSSLSMLVIDADGKIARIMAAPRPNDVGFLVGGPLGQPGLDAQGRIIYRTLGRPNFGDARPEPGKPFVMPPQPDTTPLVRFDLAARKLDTAAFVHIQPLRMNMVQTEGRTMMSNFINPLPVVDDWVVLPDGGLAIVRGHDYRVERWNADGSHVVGEKIPFDWQRLTDDDKARVIDSARTALEARNKAGTTGLSLNGGGGAGAGAGASGDRIVVSTMTIRGDGPPTTVVGGPAPAAFTMPTPAFVQPSELPDYRPAFAAGATRADAAGRLWVRTNPTKPLAAGPEYDVLDRSGKLVDRVAIPKGAVLVGFGAGDTVYLGVRDEAGSHLVRARMK